MIFISINIISFNLLANIHCLDTTSDHVMTKPNTSSQLVGNEFRLEMNYSAFGIAMNTPKIEKYVGPKPSTEK